jgi:Glycosyl transferases group 1
LIQPSLEEGYGLTVVEALGAGLPVCCSDIASLREVSKGQARLFDPTSAQSISRAIDETSAAADDGFVPPMPDAPTTADFAAQFVELIDGSVPT